MITRYRRTAATIATIAALLIGGGCGGGTIGSGLRFGGEPKAPADANALLVTVNGTVLDESGAPLSGMKLHVESPKAIDTTGVTDAAGEFQAVLFVEKGFPLTFIIDPAGENAKVRSTPVQEGATELRVVIKRLKSGRYLVRTR